MYIDSAVLATPITVIIILLAFIIVKRILLKHQINEMINTITEVQSGNDSLHLFTNSSCLLNGLTLHINGLMDSYRQQRILSAREESARKQLLSNLSHDVRTPLASVIGYLEAACKGLPTEQEKADYLDTALVKAYALKDRIDQLFELVRLDADEIVFHFEPVDIPELTRNTLIDFVPLLEHNKFQVEMDIPDTEITVITDMTAATRILQNFIRNALSHGGNGRYLGIRVRSDNVNVIIEVTDHGKGISETELPYVFDRLYQGDHARSAQGGLGLAIAKELSQKLGGDVSVISSRYETIFSMLLPIYK